MACRCSLSSLLIWVLPLLAIACDEASEASSALGVPSASEPGGEPGTEPKAEPTATADDPSAAKSGKASAATGSADEHAAPHGAPPEVARPYDEDADAQSDIEQALVAAKAGNKRVLLIFGGNWCPWCRRLEHTLQNEPEVSRALREGFEVVHIDTGARKSGKNADINERYGDPVKNGLPVLVVLDADGKPVTTQETGSLEVGDRHDPKKVLAFLERVRG